MNKSTFLIASSITLLALTGCGGGTTTSTSTSDASSSSAETAATEMSIKDLLAGGGSKECTVHFSDEQNANTKGTVYVAGGKMRGDYTTEAPEQTMKTHMIVDGTNSYAWLDGTTMGFKTTIDKTHQESSSNGRSPDVNQKMTFTCNSWSEDDSMFAVPTDVHFTEASQNTPPSHTMMPATSAGGGNSPQCAACDSLSGSQQAQCKAALGCK